MIWLSLATTILYMVKSQVGTCPHDGKYYIKGVQATIDGDPHFNMWQGYHHDYQGVSNGQYYYMHRCHGNTSEQMPFSMLGTHAPAWGYHTTLMGLQYITLELYDVASEDEYILWINDTIHAYSIAIDSSTVYNETLITSGVATTMESGIPSHIGITFNSSVFTATYTQVHEHVVTLDLVFNNYRSNGEACSLNFRMQAQAENMHFVHVSVPPCFRCFTCGLLGSFQNGTGDVDHMLSCNGNWIPFEPGWDISHNAQAYNVTGFTWERSFVKNKCKSTGRRRMISNNEYLVGDDERCDATIAQNVSAECAAARDEFSECCDLIGGSFCDRKQSWCEIDVCSAATADASLIIEDAVFSIFTDPVQYFCDVDGIELLMDEANLVLLIDEETDIAFKIYPFISIVIIFVVTLF